MYWNTCTQSQKHAKRYRIIGAYIVNVCKIFLQSRENIGKILAENSIVSIYGKKKFLCISNIELKENLVVFHEPSYTHFKLLVKVYKYFEVFLFC